MIEHRLNCLIAPRLCITYTCRIADIHERCKRRKQNYRFLYYLKFFIILNKGRKWAKNCQRGRSGKTARFARVFNNRAPSGHPVLRGRTVHLRTSLPGASSRVWPVLLPGSSDFAFARRAEPFRFYRWSACLCAEAGCGLLHARRTRQMRKTGNLGERCDSGANACMVKPRSAEQGFAV